MAVLKHLAIKKRYYGDIQRYLIFKCEEGTHKPIRDTMGRMIHRDFYIAEGMNCDPFMFDVECAELNARFRKSQRRGEIMAHHYIVSFDPRDTEDHDLTPQKAHQLAKEFAGYFFAGHQALVVTHADGNNGSGNIHTHVVINSLRKDSVPWKPFMEHERDARAGYKHHLTDALLHRMHEYLYAICERERLYTVDIHQPTEKKISDREYHAQRRGQVELNKANERVYAKGLKPRWRTYDTIKQKIRNAVDKAASQAKCENDFREILKNRYKVDVVYKRGRYSYIHPDSEKPFTARSLGNAYEREVILEKLRLNDHPIVDTRPEFASLPRIFLIPSDLRLVVDLQCCVKAQQSRAYARKVELSNLQRAAKTLAWLQENGMGTMDKLALVKGRIEQRHWELTNQLRQTESRLRETNRSLRHVGRYHANKKVYARYQQAEDKPHFREEHRSEIEAYEESLRELTKLFPDGCYPSLKELREEKAKLMVWRDELKAELKPLSADKRNMEIVWKNVQSILGTRERSVRARLQEQRQRCEQENSQRQRRRRSGPSL